MEFKGTKGKWRAEFDTHEFCDTGDYQTDAVVKSGNFTDICQVFLYDDEQEANAKLIAAAPELLEALQEYVNSGAGPNEAMQKAKKAIEKALK